MTLVLEIEYLAGVAFAAQGPEARAPDWPPQPDRVFSALVATWGARGEHHVEAEALKWLEMQPVPVIAASPAEARTAPISYVPPNDSKTGRSGDATVLPAYRRRQPRRFPASRPHDPIVRFYWEADPPHESILHALGRLAADTSYVGHSASLTRCRFVCGDELSAAEARLPTRRVYEGRFDELCNDYARFVNSSGKVGPTPPRRPCGSKPKERGQIAPELFFAGVACAGAYRWRNARRSCCGSFVQGDSRYASLRLPPVRDGGPYPVRCEWAYPRRKACSGSTLGYCAPGVCRLSLCRWACARFRPGATA